MKKNKRPQKEETSYISSSRPVYCGDLSQDERKQIAKLPSEVRRTALLNAAAKYHPKPEPKSSPKAAKPAGKKQPAKKVEKTKPAKKIVKALKPKSLDKMKPVVATSQSEMFAETKVQEASNE